MSDKQKYSKYLDYIKNVDNECPVSWFVEDWEPVGKIVLEELKQANLILIEDDLISLK